MRNPKLAHILVCLVASDLARREDHFQKKIVQNGPSLQIL